MFPTSPPIENTEGTRKVQVVMRNSLMRFDDGKDSSEKSERGCLRYIVKSIVAIVGLHLTMSVSAYTITVSYPTGGGAAVAPIHEIRKEIVDGVEWTYMTGFLYIEQDSRPKEVMYADWISMNPNGASGLMAVPGYWGVYIGDGTNAAVSASISGHVNVPSVLGECRVIGISANAFSNCTAITSVTVPEEIIKIQESAFTGCSGITEMTLPFVGTQRGNYNVRDAAFGVIFGERFYDGGTRSQQNSAYPYGGGHDVYCIPTYLRSLTITDETVLANEASCEMRCLRSVSLPSTLVKIVDSAFRDCINLRDINVPSGVRSIGGSAFRNCINLRQIDIPASVTSIGGNAFNHTGLYDIPAMPGMKYIADDLFADCWDMTKATIPEGITSIGRSAFLRCSLTEVTIPNTVTNIGHYAFDSQGSLSEIEIPSSVKSIGVVAFRGCTNLTNVILAEGLESIGDNVFLDCTALTNIIIPESVSKLGINEEGDRLLGCVFRNCTSLERVVLPSMLTELPADTFHGCKRLVDVALPSSLKSIGKYAFYDCDALVSVDIPQGVTNLGHTVFCHCDGLERVSVLGSVARIEENTFYRCTNLVNVSMQYGPQSIGSDAFYECRKLECIDIPGSVRIIGKDAFKDCSGLTQVTFNEGLEELGWGAFRGCRNVESLTLPTTLKTIGGACFWGWKVISDVVIPPRVEVIPSQAFEWCTGLKSVEIECGVRSIEGNAFGSCTGLESIKFKGNAPTVASNAFSGVSPDCIASVPCVSTGWGVSIPGTWNGLRIDYLPFDVPAGEDVVIAPQGGQTFTADDVARFVGKATPSKGREGQGAEYFKAVGRIAENGAVVIESAIDEEAVELPMTTKEVLDASLSTVDMTADAPSVTLPADSVKEGFYYGVAAAGSLDALNGLSPDLSRASGGALQVSVAKPADESAGPTKTAAFFKVVISDKQ